MQFFEQTIDQALVFVREAPALLSLLLLLVSGGLEYVFPPIPGDTFALLGGILAGQDVLPLVGVIVALTIGSTLGGLISYGVGRLAKSRRRARKILDRFLPQARMERLETLFTKYGRWVVVANRFLPGLRAYILVCAGVGGMPVRDIAIFGALSALGWNTALVGAGVVVGENLELLLDWVRRYTVAAWAVIGIVGALLLIRVLINRRRQSAPDDAP